jgi:hypothetical protein
MSVPIPSYHWWKETVKVQHAKRQQISLLDYLIKSSMVLLTCFSMAKSPIRFLQTILKILPFHKRNVGNGNIWQQSKKKDQCWKYCQSETERYAGGLMQNIVIVDIESQDSQGFIYRHLLFLRCILSKRRTILL